MPFPNPADMKTDPPVREELDAEPAGWGMRATQVRPGRGGGKRNQGQKLVTGQSRNTGGNRNDTKTQPGQSRRAGISPADKVTEPPLPPADVPAIIEMGPLAPVPVAAPVRIVMVPEAPEKVVPELKRRSPDAVVPTAFADRIVSAPEVEAAPPPVKMVTEPPVWVVPVPAARNRDPPTVLPAPAATVTAMHNNTSHKQLHAVNATTATPVSSSPH